ncbi:head GIN domain-containing protein [Agromyces binzhouensis]|uniref:head GIN domain-containing protein n=1 Tax=Agromyces binzhouensis TaxID=1817495 RepID=UPI003637234E
MSAPRVLPGPTAHAPTRAVARSAAAVLAAGVLVALTACVPFVTPGDTRTETREIGDASGVVLRGAGDMTIRLGEAPSLTVTGGENVLDRLTTEVEGDRLVIDVQRGPIVVGARDLVFDITLTSLESVLISGSGDVTAEFGDADEVALEIRGSGEIETDELDATSVRASISGSGSIVPSGTTEDLQIQVDGSGDVDASALRADSARVVLSGSGEISVDASDSLEVVLSGSGTVRYSGRPEIRSTVSGSGEITPS